MRHLLGTTFTLLLVSPLVAADAAQDAAQDPTQDKGWISIFDGKSLAGWKPNERPENWSVKDGAIVGSGARSHLYYTKHELQDFEFHLILD